MKRPEERENLCQRVYDYVKEQILNLQLRGGDRIPESMLVEELQISRTPIREGLRMLAQDGLVKLYPNRSVEVVSFSEKDIRDLGMLRIFMDMLAAKLALLYGTNAEFAKLQKLAEGCAAAVERGDLQERIRLDSDFHMTLAKISRNTFLYDYQKSLFSRNQLILTLRYIDCPTEPGKGATHADIVEALQARDEEKVLRCVRSHLLHFYPIEEKLYLKEWKEFQDNLGVGLIQE